MLPSGLARHPSRPGAGSEMSSLYLPPAFRSLSPRNPTPIFWVKRADSTMPLFTAATAARQTVARLSSRIRFPTLFFHSTLPRRWLRSIATLSVHLSAKTAGLQHLRVTALGVSKSVYVGVHGAVSPPRESQAPLIRSVTSLLLRFILGFIPPARASCLH